MSGTVFARGENPLRADKLNTAFSERVSRRGDTMQGMLTLWRDPSNPFDAATKQYVDRITVPPQGATGPAGPPGPMGPPGSIDAGSVVGPLYWTATGSTASRSAQDRSAEEFSVFDFYPGTFVNGGDITSALLAALATGKNVYVPGGYIYRLSKQIIVGVNANTPQRLRGDGKSTYFLIEAGFDRLATCVFLLRGAETNGPTICDFRLTCAQSTTATNRADFVMLGTPGAGTGLLGIKYPPAIGIDPGCNRFRIDSIRLSNCWDGIHQLDGTVSTGGWWIKNIEISAYNIGLKLGKTKDFCHVQGWHAWWFDQTATNQNVMRDGGTYGMQFGIGGETEGTTLDNISIFAGRLLINNFFGWLHFSSLMMDSHNSTLEHINGAWTLISNLYFTGTSNGANTNSQVQMAGGRLNIANLNASSTKAIITQTGGSLSLVNGTLIANDRTAGVIEHSGGYCRITACVLGANTGAGTWTAPMVHSSASTGGMIFQNNTFTSVSVGDVGGVVLDTDNANHVVIDNTFNGWGFTPPGALGAYQTGGNFYSKLIGAGGYTAGSATAAGTFLRLHATGQKTVEWYDTNILHWAFGLVGGTSDDLQVLRYNAAGAQQPQTWSINWSTGLIYSSRAGTVTTWDVLPTDMAPQTGWRAIGVQGVTGITPIIDVIATSDNTSGQFLTRRSRGTATAPTALQNNDVLGDLHFGGYDGTVWANTVAAVQAKASVNWTTSLHDTSLYLVTTAGTTLTNALILSSTAATFAVPLTGPVNVVNPVSDTIGQLHLKPANGTLAQESKVRFFGTWQTGADTGARLSSSIRSGFATGTWASGYLDFYVTTSTNDVQSDAIQTRAMRMQNNAVTIDQPLTAPSYRVGANQIAGARITGWGVATGGSKAAFDAGTATPSQTAAALAQLIADIATHGMIGA